MSDFILAEWLYRTHDWVLIIWTGLSRIEKTSLEESKDENRLVFEYTRKCGEEIWTFRVCENKTTDIY